MRKRLRVRTIRLVVFPALALVGLLVLSALPQHAAPHPAAGEIVLMLDPAASKVNWTLGTTLHTVHGTFAVKRGTLQLDAATGKIGGEIVVDAASGASGDEGRDKKMHKDVLESARFGEVVFRPDRLEGKIAPQGTFKSGIHGTFLLHGAEHELIVPVEGDLGTDHWTGSAKFSVPFVDWGLKNPGNFFLKVQHSVEIQLELRGSLKSAATP